MPSISVRKLDTNGDPMRGAGLSNFLFDLEAVTQIIGTRIKLLQGEWFANLSEGTPLFQSLLGVATTTQAVALILTQRILGTPYVLSVSDVNVHYGEGRTYTFSASVRTQFGSVAVTTGPNTVSYWGGATDTWGNTSGTWGGV